MGLSTNKNVWIILSIILFILICVTTILFYFADIFVTIIIGFILILISETIRRDFISKMEKKKHPLWKRRLYAIGLSVFWIFTIFLLISIQINDITQLVIQTQQNPDIGSNIFREYRTYIPTIFGQPIVTTRQVENFEESMFNIISTIISKITFFMFSGILIIPLLFYLYYKKRKEIFRFIYQLVPKRFKNAYKRATNVISVKLFVFFHAKLVESIVVGSICSLGFYVVGIDGWLFLGIFAGIFNIVPYIGPVIGGVPAILTGFLISDYAALFAFITVIIAQLVDNLYLIPFMISHKVRINPLLAIIIILIGYQLVGILGMVFAVPIYFVFKIILRESYNQLVKMYGYE